MMAVVITHPIDQTKIRSQTQRVRTTMLSVARRTVGDFGVRGLWTGLTGSLLRQATYGTTRFGVYGYLKEQSPANGSRSRLVMNGAIAGVFAGLVGAPAGELARLPLLTPELVMVRMCADGIKPLEQRVHYRNALHGLQRIIRDEGVSRVFRGAEATVLRSVIMNATQLSA